MELTEAQTASLDRLIDRMYVPGLLSQPDRESLRQDLAVNWDYSEALMAGQLDGSDVMLSDERPAATRDGHYPDPPATGRLHLERVLEILREELDITEEIAADDAEHAARLVMDPREVLYGILNGICRRPGPLSAAFGPVRQFVETQLEEGLPDSNACVIHPACTGVFHPEIVAEPGPGNNPPGFTGWRFSPDEPGVAVHDCMTALQQREAEAAWEDRTRRQNI